MPEKGSYYYKAATVDSNLHEKAEMEHGAYNLAAFPEYYEIQRGNNFEFCVYDLNNIEQAPGAANQYAVANAEEVIRLSVDSISQLSRVTQGVRLINLKKSNKVAAKNTSKIHFSC